MHANNRTPSLKLQIDWKQFRKEERIAPRATNLQKVEGYGKPTDRIQVLPDIVGKPWKAAHTEVTPACAGIVSTCHEVVVLKKKKREKKWGGEKVI